MLTQKEINYQRKPKRYYIIESQFRSAVHPDSHIERFRFPRYKRISFRVALVSMCAVTIAAYLLVFELGLLDPIYELFFK